MKTLTLNGIRGLKLPDGFRSANVLGIGVYGAEYDKYFWFENPVDVHLLACVCAMHWQREFRRVQFSAEPRTNVNAAQLQAARWESVAFPKERK